MSKLKKAFLWDDFLSSYAGNEEDAKKAIQEGIKNGTFEAVPYMDEVIYVTRNEGFKLEDFQKPPRVIDFGW